jgi:hypothetical protein
LFEARLQQPDESVDGIFRLVALLLSRIELRHVRSGQEIERKIEREIEHEVGLSRNHPSNWQDCSRSGWSPDTP